MSIFISTTNKNRSLMFTTALLYSVFICLLAPAANAALSISATTTATPVRPSELLVTEFTVSNTDVFARNGVVVTMTYPANLNQLFETEFDGDCVSTSCSAGETITFSLGTIAGGGNRTFMMQPVVAAGAANGTIITFAPSVTDLLLDNDSTSLDVTVDVDSLYTVALAEDSDPAIAGQLVTYTLHFGYRADAVTVNNSTLRFVVPTNATFVSATDGGALSAGKVDWALGTLSPGDSGVRQVTVQLNGGLIASDRVRASAEVFAVNTPIEQAIAQTDTSIATSRGLQLAIETNADPARSNDMVGSLITVSNHDAFTRFGVIMTMPYPQSLTQLFETDFTGNCASTTCTQGERITWTVGDIPAGGSKTMLFPPIVANATVGGVLVKAHATARDTTGLQTRRSSNFRVQNDHIYELSLSENSDPATAGSTLVYTLNFAYRGDSAVVNNSTLRFPIPVGTTFASASDGGTLNSGAVQWNLGFLNPGQGGSREMVVTLNGGLSAATVIEAQAEVFSVTAPIQRARAVANTVIASSRGLQMAIEGNSSPSRASQLLNQQIIVTNTDALTRFGVELIANFPQDLGQLFETEFDGDCASTTCTLREKITWSLGNISAGESVTVTFPAVLTSSVTSGVLIPFVAQAEDDQGVQTRQSDVLRVQSNSLYDLAIAESADPVIAGAELVYTITFGYLADAAAVNNSALRFPLPAGTTFVSATDGGVLNSGIVEWPLGFLSPDSGGQREVTVLTDNALSAATVIEATAHVASITSPIQNARAEANTIVAAAHGLQIGVETNANPARKSELTNFRLIISNHDAFTRFGVVMDAHMPQNSVQIFETEFDGDCSSTTCTAGEQISWLAGNIPAGETRTLDLPVFTASNALGGRLINVYAVATDDLGLQARRASALRVQGNTLYDLAMSASADPVVPGASLTYRLTYGYREDAGQVNNTILRMPVPTGTVFLSATHGGVLNGNNIEWTLGFLSPADGGMVSASVLVDNSLTASTVIEAEAELFSTSTLIERARAVLATVVRDTLSLALSVNAITATAEPNRELNVQLKVTNMDAFTRFGVALKGRYPQDLFQLFESHPDFTGNCASTTCTQGELIQWPLVDIPAGQSVTVTFPPTVLSNATEGSLINFLAWVNDDQGVESRASQSLFQGCLLAVDGDCDGVLNSIDNCSIVANTNQRDTDGDGFGNICDPDLNQNNIVNFADISLFAQRFQTADVHADLNGDGFVNFGDYLIMTQFFLSPPGPGATGE